MRNNTETECPQERERFLGALFDLDGVVLDTEPQYFRFWNRVGELRFPEIPDFAFRIKGQTLTHIKEQYFGIDAEALAWIDRTLTDFEWEMHYDFVSGARQYLEKLRSHGVKTALVTSSDGNKMQHVFRQIPDFGELFSCIVTSEDVSHSKPAPDGYLQAAERLGVPIGKCVVFEDSRNGLIAARRSGAYVVGLTTTLPKEEVKALSDEVIEDFQTLSETFLHNSL